MQIELQLILNLLKNPWTGSLMEKYTYISEIKAMQRNLRGGYSQKGFVK